MQPSHITSNRKATERLKTVVNALTEADLSRVIYKEGWTAAVMLAHIAFRDERRLMLKL